MLRNKVFDLILRLSPPERKRLRNFCSSEYFISSLEARRFASEVLNDLDQNGPKCSGFRIWEAAVGTSFSQSKFNSLSSSMYKQVRRFLAIEAFENSPVYSVMEVAAINRVGHYKGFSSFVDTSKEKIAKKANLEAEKFLYHYLIDEQMVSFNIKTGSYKKAPELVGYSSMLENLDAFYLISRLRLEIMTFNLSQIFNAKYAQVENGSWRDELTQLLGQKNDVHTLYRLVHAFCTGQTHDFSPILQLLELQKRDRWTQEQYDILTLVLNRTIILANAGEMDFRTSLELYRWGFKNGVFDMLEGSSIADHLKNIIKLALKSSDANFARDFVSRYLPQLDEDLKTNFVNYYEAEMAYRIGEYGTAIQSLGMVRRDSRFLYYSTQLLTAKVLFDRKEPGDEESLRSLIQAVRVAIGRDKVSSAKYLKGVQIRLGIIGRLLKYDSRSKKAAIQKSLDQVPSEFSEWVQNRLQSEGPDLAQL